MKKQIRNERGITLITLGITIIILIILASMTIYSISQSMDSSKLTAFTTELKIMQAQVNVLNEKMKNNGEVTVDGVTYKGSGEDERTQGIQDIGQDISSTNANIREQADTALSAVNVASDAKSKYKYYNAETTKAIGVEGVSQELLIDIQDREVVSLNGIKHKGKMHYNLASLPDAMYNVEHQENTSKPTFEASIKQTSGEGTWDIDISNIKYDGYIEKWQVKYKQEGEDTWNTEENHKFTVNKHGKYLIKLVNGDVESEEKECVAEYEVVPQLLEGMQPVIIDSNGDIQKANTESDNWYSYEVTEDSDMTDGGTTEGGNSKWANVVLDGNYYTWIPRYAYKVDKSVTYEGENGVTTNKIDIEFVETSITNENVEKQYGEGYKIPEAFTTEQKEVSGIWVGKYQVSGSAEEPKIVPDAEALKDLDEPTKTKVAEYFETEEIASFITNDIEFEAIDTLAKSPYGRNGTQITPEKKEEEQTLEEDEKEEKEELTTTTGNKYGVYGLYGEGCRITLLSR